jgi:hypothetical protein
LKSEGKSAMVNQNMLKKIKKSVHKYCSVLCISLLIGLAWAAARFVSLYHADADALLREMLAFVHSEELPEMFARSSLGFPGNSAALVFPSPRSDAVAIRTNCLKLLPCPA